jgi:hypothetical protein
VSLSDFLVRRVHEPVSPIRGALSAVQQSASVDALT